MPGKWITAAAAALAVGAGIWTLADLVMGHQAARWETAVQVGALIVWACYAAALRFASDAVNARYDRAMELVGRVLEQTGPRPK